MLALLPPDRALCAAATAVAVSKSAESCPNLTCVAPKSQHKLKCDWKEDEASRVDAAFETRAKHCSVREGEQVRSSVLRDIAP